MKPSTSCVHAGADLRYTRGVNTPIHPSSAFTTSSGQPNLYPRYYNTPNQEVVVRKLCQLEKATEGILFASGMAAVSTTLLSLLQQGDHVLFAEQLYGGTLHLLNSEFEKRGISYSFVRGTTAEDFAAALHPKTKIIYIESPSNPLLQVLDIAQIAALGRERKLITIIDNTFASPINQNPMELGIDIVIHSGTKYLGGHSDLSFGAVLTANTALYELVYHTAVNYGGNLNALDLYLIERSLKTLALRVERQNQNALELAHFLSQHPKVRQVNYPGLTTHPGHEIAQKQMKKGFGGMLSFVLKEEAEVNSFMERLQVVLPALSLGGVETLVCIPAQTSHVKLTKQERAELGISDGLLRLSVGIEAPEDLMEDLAQALG